MMLLFALFVILPFVVVAGLYAGNHPSMLVITLKPTFF